ncbi:MAG TPA: M23 family metallopeptidase [Rhodocyclaceae bacterium]|nr:M23 family metallopeptidase [Rhodocyclaceae bacterium]
MRAEKNRILAEPGRELRSVRRLSLIGAVFATSLLGVVAATAVVPGQDKPPFAAERVLEQLGTPRAELVADDALPFVYDERIQAGDTMQAIFRRLGIADPEALAFLMNDEEARSVLRQLRAGRSLIAMITADGRIASLNLPVGRGAERFILERGPNGLTSSGTETASVDTLVEMRSGTITHSLFGATDAAGVPDSVASRFAEIFGTQIDFSRDLREGDRFSVVYETVFDQGVPVRTGRILAAEFENQGKKHTVVLYREADGNEAYYTPDGRGLNQAFLRYPLEFTRISSSFGRRMHPIHRSWRKHNGTDFAAPSGTPIMASSDGRVSFVGRQRGYGNTIIVQHRDKYSTLYAHLKGFANGLQKGQRIRQGQIIGYVGMTGWATGPHLHYEIRVNDVPHDPMKIALPAVEPLNRQELESFKIATAPMLERLALLNYDNSGTAVARAD